MHRRRLLLALLALLAATAPAQVNIQNAVSAEGSEPFNDEDADDVRTAAAWDAQGRVSNVKADLGTLSASHGWDAALASSVFDQRSYGDATLRTLSFVAGEDPSGVRDRVFEANTTFRSRHRLLVETGGVAGAMVSLNLYVPMHGFAAARGRRDPNAGGDAFAFAENVVTVRDAAGAEVGRSVGALDLISLDVDDFTFSATGDWSTRVFAHDVRLPFEGADVVVPGVELIGFELLNIASVPTQSTLEFDVDFEMTTVAHIDLPASMFAVADFSGTGGYEVRALDGAGQAFTDFTVRPAPVPEPASFAALALGVAGLLRRRP